MSRPGCRDRAVAVRCLVLVVALVASTGTASAGNVLTQTALDFGPVATGTTSSPIEPVFTHLGNTRHDIVFLEKLEPACSAYTFTGVGGYVVDSGGNIAPVATVMGTAADIHIFSITFHPTVVAANFDCTVQMKEINTGAIAGSFVLHGSSFLQNAPDIALDRMALDLGTVTVNQTGSAQIVVSNTGNAPLTYTFAVSGPGFASTQCMPSCMLNGLSMMTHTVTFTPTVVGHADGTLTITSDDGDEGTLVVDLDGMGAAAGTTGMVNPTTGVIPFGNVPVGTTATRPFAITNSGSASVALTSATFGNAVFAIAPTTPLPITIPAGDTTMVDLSCKPGGRTSYTAVGTIVTTAGNGNVSVSLSCRGAAEVTLPGSIDFGTVAVGSTLELPDSIDLHNINRSASFVVREVRLDDATGAFALDIAPGSLAPDAHLVGGASFTPVAAGKLEARAEVFLDDDPTIHGEILLTGHAVLFEPEGGCASHGGAGWAMVALIGLVAFRRRAAWLVVLVVPFAARADVVMQTAQPPVTIADRFFQIETATVAPTSWAVGLALGYARDPLRLALTDCGGECPPGLAEGDTTPLIRSQGLAVLGAAYAHDERFELGLSVPLLAQSGRDSPFMEAASGVALGDVALRGKLRAWSSHTVALGVGATVTAPTATGGQYAGSDGVTGRLVGRATLRHDRLRIAAEAGVLVRKTGELGTLRQGSAVEGGAGALYAITPRLSASAELFGSAGLVDGAETVVQSLAGVRGAVTPELELGVAGGVAVVPGAGTPSVRGMLVVVYSPRHAPQPAKLPILVVTPPGRPDVVPPPSKPDADPDGDGVAGATDKCPNELEDKDGFQDDDGCRDPDNDGDGVLDTADACPLAAGPVDGCPDDDHDRDGVPDGFDKCAGQAETINGNADDDGCPDPGDSLVLVGKSRIDLFDAIKFANEIDLDPASANVLAQLALALRADRSIAKVQVIVHVRAQDAVDTDRSRRRAAALVAELVKRGVRPDRLEAIGVGHDKPLNAATPAAPINDRVELVIAARRP